MDTSVFVPPVEDVEKAFGRLTPAEAVLVGQQCLRVGSPAAARVVCELARASGSEDPALLLTLAAALAGCRERTKAQALVDEVLARAPANLTALHMKAHLASALGKKADARELLLRVIDVWPDFPGAQGSLASLLLPGPYYRDVLAKIHRLRRPTTYLEIGVETGATLALATTAAVAVGVDPVLTLIQCKLPPSARTYGLTSDEFFARETRESVFGARPLDVAFIDGMHWFEFALRDFVNIERWASPETLVLLHDCLPVTAAAASRERVSSFWVGDTWKVLDTLLDHRPDLEISVIPTPPSGLVTIRRLDPTSTVLAARMPDIVARLKDAEYPHEPGRWPSRYRLVENTDAGLVRALGAS